MPRARASWISESSLETCGRPSKMVCAAARQIAQEPILLAAMLPQGASPVVAQARRLSSRPRLNLLAETVQPMEGAQASWVNSEDEYPIMAEDLEEDLAAAAAVAAAAAAATVAETTDATAAETTTRPTMSSTSPASRGTVLLTDVLLARLPGRRSRRRPRCRSSHGTMGRKAESCGAKR